MPISACPKVDRVDYDRTRHPRELQLPDEAELHAVQPIERMNTPEEVASAILWLGTPASSGTTGVALPVDGGFVAR